MRSPPFRTLRTAAFVCLAASGLAAAPCQAQPCVPPEVVSKISLTDADKAAIRQCVEIVKTGLAGDENAVRKARNHISELFSAGNASVAFRIEVGRAVEPVLSAGVAADRDLVASNALYVAGEIATPGTSAIIEKALEDKRAAVRHAAAIAAKFAYESMRSTVGAALQPSDAGRLLKAVAARIGAEQSPMVLDGLVRSFEAATVIPDSAAKGVRRQAVDELVRAISAKVRGHKPGDPDFSAAAIRSGQVLRDATVNQGMPQGEPALPSATVKEIGGYAGDLLAIAKRRLAAGNVAVEARMSIEGIVRTGSGVYYFAHTSLGGSPPDVALGDLVRDGSDAEFLKKVDQFIGADGLLTKPPFEFPADRFR